MIAVYLSPIYLIVNAFYLQWILSWLKTCHSAFQKKGVRITLSVIYFFFALSMLPGMLLPGGQLKRFLKLASNYWLGILLFLSVVILPVSLVTLVLYLVRKKRISENTHRILGAVCITLVTVVCLYSGIHARDVKVNNYDITVEKDGGAVSDLKIALIADLHIGYNIGSGQIQKTVDLINAQEPDIVLIAGDIFDNEKEALDDPARLASILKSISSKYGTYAVYGNHDIEEKILAGFTFGGDTEKVSSPEMDKLLEDAGIPNLRDEFILIDDSFYVYGRPDFERLGRGITKRKLPDELMAEMDQTKPVIILDHEPRELDELAAAGADIVLNGHTHDGQIFPANLLTARVWQNVCGYLKVGNMHNIVTSGSGLFGPYMRFGTDSEICVVDVHFTA